MVANTSWRISYSLEQKLYKLQPLVIGTLLSPEFHKLYTWWCWCKRLLLFVCVCTCSLNFSSFSNCSLWFFSSCSISFWCFIASYRHIRDRNVTVEWLWCIKLSAGPTTVSQTDAGWKTWSSSLFKAKPLEPSISYSSCSCNVWGNKQRAAFLSGQSHQTKAKWLLLHSTPAFVSKDKAWLEKKWKKLLSSNILMYTWILQVFLKVNMHQ